MPASSSGISGVNGRNTGGGVSKGPSTAARRSLAKAPQAATGRTAGIRRSLAKADPRQLASQHLTSGTADPNTAKHLPQHLMAMLGLGRRPMTNLRPYPGAADNGTAFK